MTLRARWSMWSERVRSSLFALPASMLVAAIGAALATLLLDHRVAPGLRRWWWALDVGAEGTRTTLATLAGSVLTVAGVAFSMTIVVLQLASTQYSPRVIRSFRRDRLIQVVLGTYTGTFMYVLLVLRGITAAESGPSFTAPISVTVAILLGILCMILLIALVHHVARTIQVSTIVHGLAVEVRLGIEQLGREASGDGQAQDPERDDAPRPEGDGPAWIVRATRDGYVEYLDDGPVEELSGVDLVRVEVRVGDFVREGDALASVWPRAIAEERWGRTTAAMFTIGDERTMRQDVRFGLRMIVDIALRALSPGVNDPATAVHCVDVLGGLLCTLARRRLPPLMKRTRRGVRVHAARASFDDMLCLAFSEILVAARPSAPVLVAMANALEAIATRIPDGAAWSARRSALRRIAERVVRTCAERELDRRQQASIEALRPLAHADAGAS